MDAYLLYLNEMTLQLDSEQHVQANQKEQRCEPLTLTAGLQ